MTESAGIEYHDYHAYGAAADLFSVFDPELLLDGPAGTGKTRGILHRIADLCEAYPGVRALIARQTRTSCSESILVTLERDVIPKGYPWEQRDVSRAQRDSYLCANKSVIVVGGLDHPDRLYSTEWDIVYVAEAIEVCEDAWERFARAMRNHAIPKGINGGPQQPDEARALEPHPITGKPVPAFWTQRIADCNPGAPAHWLNQRCIDGRMKRLLSRHEDNPSVSEDFLTGLRALTGHRRARLYEGKWVAAEGSVFPEFSADRNVLEVGPAAAFPLGWPADWPVVVGYDSGYDHPAAVIFYGLAPNEQPFIIDSIYQSGLTLEDLGHRIVEKARAKHIISWLADPRDVFKKTAHASGKTIADFMRDRYQLHFQPWEAKRKAEVQNQVEAVRDLIKREKPLVVWSTCPDVIGEFQSWSYKRMSDGSLPIGDDAYCDSNNHAMDAILGIVASCPRFTPLSAEVYLGSGE